MNKKRRIVLFNGIMGLIVSTILFFVIDYIVNVTYNFEVLLPITPFECLFYGIFAVNALFDIAFSKNNIRWKFKRLLLLAIISPPLWCLIAYALHYEFWFTDIFAKYCPYGITLTYLFHEIFVKKNPKQTNLIESTHEYSVQCAECGAYFPIHNAFCPECYTISPRVSETRRNFPKKHYLDFTEVVVDFKYVRCPHCNHYRRGSSFIYPRELGTPFHACDNCNEFYTSRSSYEWVVISPFRKLQYCLYGDDWLGILIVAFGVFLLICTYSIPLALLFLAVLFVLRFLWLRLITIFDIRESEARLNANPDYPQILADMGYEILDTDYKHMYRRNK